MTVELVDLERGQSRTAVTNQGGYFALRAVPSGEYDLVASLAGFRTSRRENVRLLVGQSLEMDLRLGLAAVEGDGARHRGGAAHRGGALRRRRLRNRGTR